MKKDTIILKITTEECFLDILECLTTHYGCDVEIVNPKRGR